MNRTGILISAVLLCITAFSQNYDDDILNNQELKAMGLEKDDNLITITTDRDPEANYVNFGRHLITKGFTFKTKDKDFMILMTDPKDPKHGYDYAMNITFQDTLIVIRVKQSGMSVGASMMGDVQIIWTDWHFAKGEGNIMNQSFDDFYPILLGYGYPVSFTRE